MGKVWLSVSSTLLAFAFVFGNSIRTVYESIIFLFVIHPFDVGDAIVVHDDYYRVRLFSGRHEKKGPSSQVEEISLMFTVLCRVDNAIIWYPNAKLYSEPMINLSKSKNKWEKLLVRATVFVHRLHTRCAVAGRPCHPVCVAPRPPQHRPARLFQNPAHGVFGGLHPRPAGRQGPPQGTSCRLLRICTLRWVEAASMTPQHSAQVTTSVAALRTAASSTSSSWTSSRRWASRFRFPHWHNAVYHRACQTRRPPWGESWRQMACRAWGDWGRPGGCRDQPPRHLLTFGSR